MMGYPPEDFSCPICGMDTEDLDNIYVIQTGHCSKACQQAKEKIPSIRPMYDLLARILDEEAPGRWSNAVYKNTSCGAWLNIEGIDEIRLGAMVEGTDTEVEPITLKWPFTEEDFEASLRTVKDDSDVIWMATHGCDTCGEMYLSKFGMSREDWSGQVHPDCPDCDGEGTII